MLTIVSLLCVVLLVLFAYALYRLNQSTKKYNILLSHWQITEKSQRERVQLQEQILSQLENPTETVKKNKIDFLSHTCENLAQGLCSNHVMIFCPEESDSSIKCRASFPGNLLSRSEFKHPVPLKSGWPQAHTGYILTRQFLNRHYDLSAYSDCLIVNIEHKNSLYALLVIERPQINNDFYPEDNLFIYTVISMLVLYFESKQKTVVERQLFKQYYFDTYSQLPNLKSLTYQLNSVLSAYPSAGLLFLEVANLISVNNVYGMHKGDDLLLQVSERLQKIMNAENFTARISQNRFTILSYGQELQTINATLSSLFEQISEPFSLGGQKISIPLNGGVALFPNDAVETNQLIEQATQALQIASIKTPGKMLLFDNITTENFNKKQELTIALHKALEQNELVVYFQPFLSTENFTLKGAEALMRWNSKQFGQLSPDNYIPLAEETGIIKEMGLWVLENACKQAKMWQQTYFEDFTIAVNVSPIQLLDPQFAQKVLDILEKIDLRPETLELEITEMIASQEDSVIDNNVRLLVEHNIGFAIDDFGSGYASFHYIKRFATKKIKIDRKFTENIENSPQDASLVKVIVAMGHALNAKVTAEGISTLEQFGALKNIGCDYVQGYFIAQPMPTDQFEQFLSKYFPK